MAYEVEVKFRVSDLAAVRAKLAEMNARLAATHRQEDHYYAHPTRDFRQTDEAFRLRVDGAKNELAYKGPKVDALTKTRREVEVPLADGPAARERWGEVAEALGFPPVRVVRKTREVYPVPVRGTVVEVAIDQVDGLAPHVELEAPASNEAELDVVRARVLDLARSLGLQEADGERRSYLELLELDGLAP